MGYRIGTFLPHKINLYSNFFFLSLIFSPVGGYLYANYKINQLIDYIDISNILDKEEITSSEEASSEETTSDREEVTSSEEAISDNDKDSPEDKLTKLSELKEKGLIDEEDYNSKKEEILKTI